MRTDIKLEHILLDSSLRVYDAHLHRTKSFTDLKIYSEDFSIIVCVCVDTGVSRAL